MEGIENPLSVAYNLSVSTDLVSQRQRGPLLKQFVEVFHAVKTPENCIFDNEEKSSLRANDFGKFKTGIQVGTHIAYGVTYTNFANMFTENPILIESINSYLKDGSTGVLYLSVALASKGMYDRWRNSKTL